MNAPPERRDAWLVVALCLAIGIAVPIGMALLSGAPPIGSTTPAGAVPSPTPSSQAVVPSRPDATSAPTATPRPTSKPTAKPTPKPTAKPTPKPTPRSTPRPDTRRPTISGRTPAPNAANVPGNTTIRVVFSEPVRNVSASTVQLVNVAGGWPVRATVQYVSSTRSLTLIPVQSMYPNTVYRVEIGSGISDLARNPLAPVSWTFRTARG